MLDLFQIAHDLYFNEYPALEQTFFVLDCIFTVEPRPVTVHNIGAAFDGFLDDDGIGS